MAGVDKPSTARSAMRFRITRSSIWGQTEALAPQPRRLMAGPRDIFRIAAAVLMDAFRRQLQHAVGERRQKMPVMREERRLCNKRVRRGALGDL